MDAKKALYRKYFPNSHISDADLSVLLNSLAKYYPGKPLKSVFVEMQRDIPFGEDSRQSILMRMYIIFTWIIQMV